MKIQTEYIKLDSLMKLISWVDSGGMAKTVIANGEVRVNGEVETRRGRKLYPGDSVQWEDLCETIE
ncbi:ribosome-associated protein [Aedoeadaptatus ivorii]|uniref:Ribosome-associated protein n=1 Tax=Aedoeadaptatus ivorii TaxID=54006 RepID=A0A448UZH7_9FIRM|nr:S4 domain-containing protein YaaA [Peptoniphilus ivorii]MDQ0508425.1 ribosome-associated protein [Peptoniphilus ivorii]VEJ34143.1 ribosome-associated protein [Peptoniphilus ivorii]